MKVSTNSGKVRRRSAWNQGLLTTGAALVLVFGMMGGNCIMLPGVPTCDPACDDGFTCTAVTDADGVTTNVCQCDNDASCDDGDACTTDTCGDDGTCSNDAVVCDDSGDLCAPNECNADTGDCEAVPVECAEGETCVDGDCVSVCETDGDCDDGDLCTDDACVDGACENTAVECPEGESCNADTGDCEPPAGAGLSVSISGCPTDPADVTNLSLSASVSNATGTVTYAWSSSEGSATFDDPTAQSVVYSGSASATITVTVTDNEVTTPDPVAVDPEVACTDDADCADGEVCFNDVCSTPQDDVLTPGDTATATCTVQAQVGTQIEVNAGADRVFTAGNADFTGAAFAAGSQLTSGTGVVTALTAVVSDPDFADAEITVDWSVAGVPQGADPSDVTLINTSAATTNFIVIPKLTNTSTILNNTGASATVNNTVLPGDYTFQVVATNPAGFTASDTVTYNITPGFSIPAGGTAAGIAMETGQLVRRVTRPTTVTLNFTVLDVISGTLQFILEDDGNANNSLGGGDILGGTYTDFVANQSLNTVDLVGDGTTKTVTATASSSTRGTYLVSANLSAGAGTVGTTALHGTGGEELAVHFTPELTGNVDVTPPFATSTLNHFGLVNSTNLTNAAPFKTMYHGGRAPQGVGDWDAPHVMNMDVNGDGFAETILAGPSGGANQIIIYRGVDEDPTVTGNSPIDNAAANEGALPSPLNTSGVANVMDVIDLTDANTTGTVTNVGTISDLCFGDFNGDGNKDLAVGEGGFNGGGAAGSEGRVLVFYGQGNNGFDQNPWTTDGTLVSVGGGQLVNPDIITRPDANTLDDDWFGHTVECGDVNGDNLDDLIVGAPGGGQAVTAGASGILVNGAAQTGTTLTVDTIDATTVFQPGDIMIVDQNDTANSIVRRVTAVTATQITVDVAIGTAPADNETVDEITGATGAVFGFFGNAFNFGDRTVLDTGDQSDLRLIPSSSISGDMIGASLLLADTTGDGINDIIFGAPGRRDSATTARIAAGVVFIRNGSTSLSGNVAGPSLFFEGNANHLGFGRTLAAGNFDSTSGLDLAIGAVVSGGATPSLNVAGTGRVYLISGGTSSIQSAAGGTSSLTSVPQISGSSTDADLGSTLAMFDFNGDTFDDILTTSPAATDANQSVKLINGLASPGATLSASATLTDRSDNDFLTVPAAVNLFVAFDEPLQAGAALRRPDAGTFVDVNGDGVKDLFFAGIGDIAAVSDAYFIAGAE